MVTGRDRDNVIRAYGGDPGQDPVVMLFADAAVGFDELGAVSLVQVRQEGPHVLMIENVGWLGKSEGVAQRASADGGDFIAVHWDLNANTWITQAKDGRLRAGFEPLNIVDEEGVPFVPPRQLPETWHTFPDWIQDVQLPISALPSAMLAIVEWQSGLAFDRSWLDEPMPTYRIAYQSHESPMS